LVIDGNAQTGPVTLHVRYPAGHTVGPHKHKSDEHVTVLSGTLLLGWGNVSSSNLTTAKASLLQRADQVIE